MDDILTLGALREHPWPPVGRRVLDEEPAGGDVHGAVRTLTEPSVARIRPGPFNHIAHLVAYQVVILTLLERTGLDRLPLARHRRFGYTYRGVV